MDQKVGYRPNPCWFLNKSC